MYEYNNENRPQDPWSDPIETTGRPVHEEPEQPKPRKKKGGKLVALCLVCAIIGGIAGGAGVGAATGAFAQDKTTIYEGTRTPTVVNVSNVTGKDLLTAPEIYATYVGSTVGITTEITTTNVWGQPVSQAAAGSGFVITSDGYILTNYHVIEDADSIQVAFVDGTTYDATLVGGESENDIAVLKIDATGLTPVIIGDSDNVKVGEQVVAIGNPLGELTFSMTSGIVSAKDRSITMENGNVMNMIQTDTAINNGNSGGPLFDMYGQVIGITSAKLSGSSSSKATIEGLGFAIPINDIKDMVTDIMENGYVTGKPYMGITVSTVPESISERYGMSQGALVESVDESSCAAKAGLEKGDIITAMDGKTVISSAELVEAKKNYKAGDTVTLEVERNGEKLELTLTFDEDNPERRAAQEEAQEQQEQQSEQSSNSNSGSYFWPFGDLSPWFY
ncbi:S1C family serine protease [Intestinimonas timonensis]|uniref:S1C family serine protease n=1 Tax=Intestinimonas timonensis TaxID=1689270 RepID=UPI0010321AEB|nr:trypsin-like peptidase domain-containing protein [Intestinimonas timonensis]